jgi:hypothetical protein
LLPKPTEALISLQTPVAVTTPQVSNIAQSSFLEVEDESKQCKPTFQHSAQKPLLVEKVSVCELQKAIDPFPPPECIFIELYH